MSDQPTVRETWLQKRRRQAIDEGILASVADGRPAPVEQLVAALGGLGIWTNRAEVAERMVKLRQRRRFKRYPEGETISTLLYDTAPAQEARTAEGRTGRDQGSRAREG